MANPDPDFRIPRGDLKVLRRSGGRMTTFNECGQYLRFWWHDESGAFLFKTGKGVHPNAPSEPEKPAHGSDEWLATNEQLREKSMDLIRQLSPEGFLRQRYPDDQPGRMQMEAFLVGWIMPAWPQFSEAAAKALARAVYQEIIGVIRIANGAESPIESFNDFIRARLRMEKCEAMIWEASQKAASEAVAEFHKPEPKTLAEIMEATFDKPALGGTPATFDADLEKIVAAAQKSESERAVKASEFGLAPQVGKTLLDGLKRIRDRYKRPHYVIRLPQDMSDAFDEMLALIAEAEKPGFPVPPAAATGTSWRLPTLAECEGDPEATRVWNAVHKPPLEWHAMTDGLPPQNNDEAETRPVWIKWANDQWPRICRVDWIHDLANARAEMPTHWCEVEPPLPLPLPKEKPAPNISSIDPREMF